MHIQIFKMEARLLDENDCNELHQYNWILEFSGGLFTSCLQAIAQIM